jgi:hypothetical protein
MIPRNAAMAQTGYETRVSIRARNKGLDGGVAGGMKNYQRRGTRRVFKEPKKL